MEEKEIKDFYNDFVSKQDYVGINQRHFSILEKSKSLGLKRDHQVLEIGCGIGTFTKLLSKFIKSGNILAVDISDKSIELAQQRFNKLTNVEFLVLDLTKESLNRKFDSIILPDVIEHIPLELHPKLFRTIYNLLKDDGKVFIHIPNPSYLKWCIKEKPELLQIIDQPIYTNLLLSALEEIPLHIHTLQTYSIWVKHGDYQFICLRKNDYQNFNLQKKQNLFSKIHFKLRKVFRIDK